MNEVALILSICAILFAGTTAVFSFLAYANVVGLKNSTHKVEWVPYSDDGSPMDKEEKERLKEMEKQLNPNIDSEYVDGTEEPRIS